MRGGPCEYRHWHVRHDEPVWLGSLPFTRPSLLSFCLLHPVSSSKTFSTLSLLFFLSLTLPTLVLSLSPLRVFSCDLALSRSSGKCDWRAGESVVVGLQAP